MNETEKQALAEPNSTPPPAITTPSRPAGLDSTLHQLVIAEDRTQFAQQRGLDIRDDTVLVTIEVTPDNQLPQSIPIDVKTRSANKILAYVAIEDLTTLAQNEAIRTVRVPETGNADTDTHQTSSLANNDTLHKIVPMDDAHTDSAWIRRRGSNCSRYIARTDTRR